MTRIMTTSEDGSSRQVLGFVGHDAGDMRLTYKDGVLVNSEAVELPQIAKEITIDTLEEEELLFYLELKKEMVI